MQVFWMEELLIQTLNAIHSSYTSLPVAPKPFSYRERWKIIQVKNLNIFVINFHESRERKRKREARIPAPELHNVWLLSDATVHCLNRFICSIKPNIIFSSAFDSHRGEKHAAKWTNESGDGEWKAFTNCKNIFDFMKLLWYIGNDRPLA